MPSVAGGVDAAPLCVAAAAAAVRTVRTRPAVKAERTEDVLTMADYYLWLITL